MPTTATKAASTKTGTGEGARAKAAVKTVAADVAADVTEAAKAAERSFVDATEQARERLVAAAHRTEAAVREGLESLRTHTRAYTETATEQFDEAQRYVVDRVKERPVTATLTGLGVGVLIGLLLASRGDRR